MRSNTTRRLRIDLDVLEAISFGVPQRGVVPTKSDGPTAP
jgi:hypothetical protein